jgi:hypothetical protein
MIIEVGKSKIPPINWFEYPWYEDSVILPAEEKKNVFNRRHERLPLREGRGISFTFLPRTV